MTQFAQPNFRASQAYQFLQCVLPWPPDGKDNYMSLHWSYIGKDKKVVWWGAVYKDLDEMTRAAINKAHEASILGVYVCMASQRTAVPKITRAGNNILVPSRIAANAAEHRSFYLDVDVKDKAYKSTEDAIRATAEFISAAGLPPPTAGVATGSGGFHLHWVLHKPIPTDQWRPYSDALASAVRQFGLIADTQCTVDAVRILRVPDTFNKKSGDAKPVVLLRPIQSMGYPNDELLAALKPYLNGGPAVSVAPAAFTGAAPIPFVPRDDLSAGVVREARPVHAHNVAAECGFVAEAVATAGRDYSEPAWNLTTLLSVFMEDGRAQAHNMAKGHPDYTVESTDAKFTRKQYDKNNGIGWPSCRSIAAVSAKCKTCPHRDEGKSPLHWGHDPTPVDKHFAETTTDEALPHGYVQDAEQRIFRASLSEEGTTSYSPVCNYAIKDGWLQEDPWALCFKAKIVHAWRPMQLPIASIEKRTIAAFLGNLGFGVPGDQAKALGDFFMAWIHKLQESKDKVLQAGSYGWQTKGGNLTGFTYAGNNYSPEGTRPAATADQKLAKQYSVNGDMDPWRKAVKFITDQRRPALDCVVATAFAAPLMRFTGQRGGLLSAYSIDSGVGKSTAVSVAAAVWGHPVKTTQALDDTLASVIHKIGETRSLPLFWDEIKTDEEMAKFAKLQFTITGGKEKSRMTPNVTQRDVGTWETLAIVCSNDTMIDEIIKVSKSTAAGIYRMLEFIVPISTAPQGDFIEVGKMILTLNDNHGHAGEIYAKYLGENLPKLDGMVKKIADDLTVTCAGKPEERFWFVCSASLLAGAFVANGLGLTDIDFRAMRKFLIDAIIDMRQVRNKHSTDIASPHNIEELLSTYMNVKRFRHTLWTNRMIQNKVGKPRGNKSADFAPLPPTDVSRLEALEIHVAKQDGVMRLALTPLREWIAKTQNLKPTSVVAYLVKQYGAAELNGVVLGGGTAYATGGMRCIEINFAGTRLNDFIDNLSSPKDDL